MSSVYVYNNKLLLTQSNRALAPKTRRLPDEYQEVEWIESTGTQYIQLNHKLSNESNIRMTFSFNDFSGDNYGLFGARDSSASSKNIGAAITISVQRISVDFNNSDYSLYRLTYNSATTNTIYKIICNKDRRTITNSSGTIIATNDTVCNDVFSTTNNVMLFKQEGNASSPQALHGKIYEYEDGVSKLVPCYRKVGTVIGMYDLNDETFYTNAGTGTFTKGADV